MSTGFDRPPRRAFRLRTPLTLMVLVAVLAAASWYAVRKLQEPPRASPPGHCTARLVTAPPAGAAATVSVADVRVTVFNLASGRRGQAAAVSAQLEQRGFTTGTPGNDTGTVTGVALVRAADRRLPAVALVLAQVPGATFQPITRYDPSVDLVIGPKFARLAAKAPTTVKVTTRSAQFPADCRTVGQNS